MADPDRREEILAAGACFGFQGYVLVGIQQNHARAWYYRACGVLYRSRNCSFIHLTECEPALKQKEARACDDQEAKLPDPSESVAKKGHPSILISCYVMFSRWSIHFSFGYLLLGKATMYHSGAEAAVDSER